MLASSYYASYASDRYYAVLRCNLQEGPPPEAAAADGAADGAAAAADSPADGKKGAKPDRKARKGAAGLTLGKGSAIVRGVLERAAAGSELAALSLSDDKSKVGRACFGSTMPFKACVGSLVIMYVLVRTFLSCLQPATFERAAGRPAYPSNGRSMNCDDNYTPRRSPATCNRITAACRQRWRSWLPAYTLRLLSYTT